MKPLVIIPARGGSKGVPRKNIKFLGGKPLIEYTLNAAKQVTSKDLICVSTEDQEIKEVVESLGFKVPFLRPENLATDTAGTYEVLLHAIEFYKKHGYEVDVLILLQATSPFRTSNQIQEALSLFDESCDMVVSVNETNANPYYTLREENQEGWLVKSKDGAFTRRQDCPKVYELNGAIYIINVNSLIKMPLNKFSKVRKYEMNEFSSLDIDSELDWDFASYILNKSLQ
jgi:CMP-N,N'-diacetyllegionaminic acid synthase